MNARELLQLNDQLIAFNALIKGDLAKEVKEAKDALAALGSAQSIAKDKQTLEQEKVAFEDYKVSVKEVLDETKEALKQEQENVKKAFADLQLEKEKISKLKSDFVTEYDVFLNYKDNAEREIKKGQTDLAFATAKVTADQLILDKAFSDIAAKENKITEKLAAIKALAK